MLFIMPNRSEYQPLSQGIDEEEEADVVESLSPAPQPSPHLRRPGNIDLSKLDTAFKRYARIMVTSRAINLMEW